MGQRCEPGNSWIVRGADVDGGNGAGKADAFGNSGRATLHTDVLQIHFEILTSFNCQLFPMCWSTLIVNFSQGAGQTNCQLFPKVLVNIIVNFTRCW